VIPFAITPRREEERAAQQPLARRERQEAGFRRPIRQAS
jgi:hypothetical protein